MTQRLSKYLNSVKRYWNETYEKEGFHAAHDAGNEEKTARIAKAEMAVFLDPTKESVDLLLADKVSNPDPTFGPNFINHPKVVGDLKTMTALEYGCGYMGRYSVAMSEHFKQVIGVDVSEVAIDAAKQNAPPNVSYLCTDGTNLSGVKDRSVDFVFSNLVFQHIGNKEIVVGLTKEISRVLKPGGQTLLEYGGSKDWKPTEWEHPYHGNGFTRGELFKMYLDAGLKTLAMTEYTTYIWVSGVKKEEDQ